MSRHYGAAVAPLAASVQGETGIAAAEKAVRLQLEKQIPDFWVTLQALVVMAPASGVVYTFQAYESVSGLGGEKRFRIDGTYDAGTRVVKVLHKVTF